MTDSRPSSVEKTPAGSDPGLDPAPPPRLHSPPPPRLPPGSSSGLPIAAIGILAVAAGFHHGAPAATAFGMALFLFACFVYAALRVSARGLRLRRLAPTRAFEGDVLEVKICIANRSRLPIFFPVAAEVFPPEIHAEKITEFPSRLDPRDSAVESYEATCLVPRGLHALGSIEVTISDPLGWFRVRKRFSSRAILKVYPLFRPLGMTERLGARMSRLVDDLSQKSIGDSSEFFSVREYQIGDPLRKIHWGLTAHRGFPVVRENAKTAAGSLFIFLDAYRLALLGLGRGSSFEQSVKVAAGLSARALDRGHRVDLVCEGRTSTRVSARGKGGTERILDALVAVRPDGSRRLEEVLAHRAVEVPQGASCVLMVSPYLQDSAECLAILARFIRRGMRVALVVFDGSTFKHLYPSLSRDDGVEAFTARARRIGAEVFLLPCGARLEGVFAPTDVPHRPAIAREAGGQA